MKILCAFFAKYQILIFGVFLMMLNSQNAFAQKPKQLNSAEIYTAIEKLNFLGSVLYVAAHPDDENTRLISYLSNEVKARTAYLSLTRGDGGQNLIGKEIQELLGVLRTQELMMARSVDGGEQYFSRAIDFGYSKHPDETLEIWNKDEVLSDVVRVMRQFRPDVIINRFDHRTPGKTHGHHTASAMLSVEAFDMIGDASIYPDQLTTLQPWNASRQFFNTSWWFYGSREKFAEADKSNLMSFDIGGYYPMLGKSNTEIAAEARSMHKCQGFGSAGSRGAYTEYVELLNGDMPADKSSIFNGINTTWSRVNGGEPVGALMTKILSEYDFTKPQNSISDLLKVYQLISNLNDDYWKPVKLKEVKNIIQACMGLYLEASADVHRVTYGDSIEIKFEMINRSEASMILSTINLVGIEELKINDTLTNNQRFEEYLSIEIDERIEKSSHYWLRDEGSFGMFNVDDISMIGKPETPRTLTAVFIATINGVAINFSKDIVYQYVDPSIGQLYRPFEVLDPVYVSIDEDVVIFPDEIAKEISVKLSSGTQDISGKVSLDIPSGWKVEPINYDYEIDASGESKYYNFTVTPPSQQSTGFIAPKATYNGEVYRNALIDIDYAHIPYQSVTKQKQTKVAKLDIKKYGKKIGYIPGAGDKISECLTYIGYDVEELDISNLDVANLPNYDAIILGIRAYNTIEDIDFQIKKLNTYVENGGTLITQYNTSRRLKSQNLGPYSISLGRFRVSQEDAEVRIIAPDHPVMNVPNKITSKDFDGWIQERGLYFPSEWDEAYTPILSLNDPGEDPADGEGSLLVAEYGKGHFIYTSLSWFRELPAGVPGAYRIFTNLISLGNEE